MRVSIPTLALCWLGISVGAAAQDGPRPGDGANGMPGLGRVPVIAPGGSTATIAGTAGYGFTDALPGESGAHHRIAGTLGVGVRPTDWLGLWLRVDGRYDNHPDDTM